jgi:small conductance mechanosensitive channel
MIPMQDDLVHEAIVVAPKIAMGLLVFVAFWLASSLVGRFAARLSRATDFNTRFIIKLAGRTSSIALLLFGGVTALGTMGINVSALVAGLGLTGFALGFALKDVLANLMAGVLILLYRPFGLNDRIAVTGLEGTVTEIDLRYTRLQGDGRTYLIPNSVLFTNSITLVSRAQPDIRDKVA